MDISKILNGNLIGGIEGGFMIKMLLVLILIHIYNWSVLDVAHKLINLLSMLQVQINYLLVQNK